MQLITYILIPKKFNLIMNVLLRYMYSLEFIHPNSFFSRPFPSPLPPPPSPSPIPPNREKKERHVLLNYLLFTYKTFFDYFL